MIFSKMTSTLFFLAMLSLSGAHQCVHDDKSEHFHPSTTTPARTKTDDGGEFRIQVEFLDLGPNYYCNSTGDQIQVYESPSTTTSYTCREEDVLTTEKDNYMRTLILDAVTFWETAMRLRETDQLALSFTEGSTCYIANHTSSVQADTDYVLYVAFQPTSSSYSGADSTLAWALACTLASGSSGSFHFGRPVAGHLNMGPSSIQGTTAAHYYSDIDVARHELAHALGFASSQFSKFLNASAMHYPDGDLTFQVTERGHTVTKVRSPNVLEAARHHFDCPTLNGAEIEDGGGSGTALSHWEARVFNSEFMIGFIKEHMYVSNITLALFDDMGWYVTNRSYAEPLAYGQGTGCDFAVESCDTRDANYFCTASQQLCEQGYEGCSIDRLSKAVCDKIAYGSALPTDYQYFAEPTYGGFDPTADYCPYFSEHPDGNCLYDKGQDQVYGEVISLQSRCFQSNVSPIPTVDGDGLTYAGPIDNCGFQVATRCHQQECISKTGEVRVFVSDTHSLRCPVAGGLVDVHDGIVADMGVSCSDSTTFEIEAGQNCLWLAANDEYCLTHGNADAQTNCPLACKTCVAYQGTITCPAASELGCEDTEPPILNITSSVLNGETTYEEPVVFTITSDEPLDYDVLPIATTNCGYKSVTKVNSMTWTLSCAAAHEQDITVATIAGTIADPNGLYNDETTTFTVSSLDVTAPEISLTARYIVGNTTDDVAYTDLDYVPTTSPMRFEVAIPENGTLSVVYTLNCNETDRGVLSAYPPVMYIDCRWGMNAVVLSVTAQAIDEDNITLVSSEGITLMLVTPTPTPTPDGSASGVLANLIIYGLEVSEFDEDLFAEAVASAYDIVHAKNITVVSVVEVPPDGVEIEFLIAALFQSDANAIRNVMQNTPPNVLADALSAAFNLTLTAGNATVGDFVQECLYGRRLNNSHTTCSGFPGYECNYTCVSGTVAVGDHICYANRSFVGGACTTIPLPEESESFFDKYKTYIYFAVAVIVGILFCCCWYRFLKWCTKGSKDKRNAKQPQ